MILDKIVDHVRSQVEKQKKQIPLEQLKQQNFIQQQPDLFKNALNKSGIQIIAEIKKASPSAGVIAADFNPLVIARDYENGGAAAISILTEEKFFQGSLNYLKAVRDAVSTPLFRKDFIIDLYQLYQARHYGAHAVLLIASILTAAELLEFTQIAEELNMNTLVEVHNEIELEAAVESGAGIIGIPTTWEGE